MEKTLLMALFSKRFKLQFAWPATRSVEPSHIMWKWHTKLFPWSGYFRLIWTQRSIGTLWILLYAVQNQLPFVPPHPRIYFLRNISSSSSMTCMAKMVLKCLSAGFALFGAARKFTWRQHSVYCLDSSIKIVVQLRIYEVRLHPSFDIRAKCERLGVQGWRHRPKYCPSANPGCDTGSPALHHTSKKQQGMPKSRSPYSAEHSKAKPAKS